MSRTIARTQRPGSSNTNRPWNDRRSWPERCRERRICRPYLPGLREKSRIALVLPTLWGAAAGRARAAASRAGDPAARALETVAALGNRRPDARLRCAARARRAVVRSRDARPQHLGRGTSGPVLLLADPAAG